MVKNPVPIELGYYECERDQKRRNDITVFLSSSLQDDERTRAEDSFPRDNDGDSPPRGSTLERGGSVSSPITTDGAAAFKFSKDGSKPSYKLGSKLTS